MHLAPHAASVLLNKLDLKIKPHQSVNVVICPPHIDLYSMASEINKDKFKLGAQDCHYLDEGAYTGEISAAMLSALVSHVIIGHSERRRHNHEDDKLISRKVAAAIRHGLFPVLCVGESLMDRQHNHFERVVIDQLTADLANVTQSDITNLTIAYEPVWAIGTGDFAKPADVAPMVSAIRNTIEELYGEESGSGVKVLYGGSVDKDNASAYLKLDGIDGLLVGGASLNPEQFPAIVEAAQALE